MAEFERDADKKEYAKVELEFNEKMEEFEELLERSQKVDQKTSQLLKLQKREEHYIQIIKSLL